MFRYSALLAGWDTADIDNRAASVLLTLANSAALLGVASQKPTITANFSSLIHSQPPYSAANAQERRLPQPHLLSLRSTHPSKRATTNEAHSPLPHIRRRGNTSRTGFQPPHPRRDVRRGCVRRPPRTTIPLTAHHSRRHLAGRNVREDAGRRPRYAVRFQATETAIGGRAAVLRGAGPVAEERPAAARRFRSASYRLVVRGLRLARRWRVDAVRRRPPRLALLGRVDGVPGAHRAAARDGEGSWSVGNPATAALAGLLVASAGRT